MTIHYSTRAVSKNYVQILTFNNDRVIYRPQMEEIYQRKKQENPQMTDIEIQTSINNELEKTMLPWNIDTKIKVYEDQINSWFFDIAKELTTHNEAGFVIVLIVCAQMESNQQYFEGGRDKLGKDQEGSRKCFIRAIKRFFPDFENTPINILEDFYSEVRCGLMHDAMTKYHVTINASASNPIALIMKVISNGMQQEVTVFENGKITNVNTGEFQQYNKYIPLETISTEIHEIVINPHLFLKTVENGINEYIERVKDVKENSLRSKFQAMFDKRN